MPACEVERAVEAITVRIARLDEDGDPVLLKEPPVLRAKNESEEGRAWLTEVEVDAASREGSLRARA